MEFLDHIVFGNSVLNYILFASILFVGLAFKKIFSRCVGTLSFKLLGGFGTGQNAHVFVSLLLRPIELLFTCTAAYLAINQLDYPLNKVVFSRKIKGTTLQIPSHYEVTAINIIDKVFEFLFIVSAFWIILRIIDFIAHVFMQKASLVESKMGEQMIPFIKDLAKVIAIILGAFVIMGSVFELNIAAIVAGLGVGGIAIGLAAQDTLKNLLGSFTIFADKPFVVGDHVRVDKFEGTVERVGFRSTLLRTVDKTLVTIPNSRVSNDLLENLTLRNLRRVKFDVGLEYDTPLEKLKMIAKEIESYVSMHHGTREDALVHFDAFGPSSLNLQVRYYIEEISYSQYSLIREEVNYKIMEIVYQHEASFAFPSQTLYVKTSPQPSPKERG